MSRIYVVEIKKKKSRSSEWLPMFGVPGIGGAYATSTGAEAVARRMRRKAPGCFYRVMPYKRMEFTIETGQGPLDTIPCSSQGV